MTHRYAASERQLDRALATIPLGAQTFSKSTTQFPHGVSPYFAARAEGARLWDVDGNEYIDFVNALAAVTLGYADPDVNAAVAEQLGHGTVFSLSHALESEVAELICAMVPSAEAVRFGKNGSDATAGAVRLARAFTGRDHVLACGYHGWQDWYIGATARHRGVPEAVRALTHTFPYNDLPAVERLLGRHRGAVAAIMLEPMNVAAPAPGYLEGLKALAAEAGALLIFDETITGFRYAPGGAQELFGVTPDLTTLGKGIANGFPLAALCGRADVMRLMTEIFFSFTMGGETLSLAAAKAALTKLRREPVIETLRARGTRLLAGAEAAIARAGAGGFLATAGDPTWSFLVVRDAPGATALEIKTLWLQEIFSRGILSLGTHNLSYAHAEVDIDRLVAVYDEVFPLLAGAVAQGDVPRHLRCAVLEPLFRVR
ncbi:3-aminobutyryl-CoA aminotransferase [Methylobacterium crusticola]|uniref:3-aminobutyryl-CoA aminotransferase n=1 Tax=Methylobacterium crusticola TaxID=1697972 RepID=A0ABQ4QQF4_9HYPH|nr:aminotransferase class III-fold pyridoxal phosphate-dependent enzyme [Methylobacterium crusticola]GJD47520.1 3-aminobutyryl-CoA aminotransferase [Methylobacterium crusticola]